MNSKNRIKQKTDSESDKRVNYLVSKIRTSYPNLYGSIGGRYVRRLMRELYSQPSKRRYKN